MTAICGGGPSTSKPGFGTTVVVTSAAIEGALTLLGLEAVAAVLAPIIAGTTYELTTFCSTDPPADPGLNAQDLLDILNWADPTVSIPAINKAKTWFESYYWYTICECSSGTTPAAPTPSNPGTITTNPGLPTGPATTPCWDIIYTVQTPSNNTDLDYSRSLFPATTIQPINPPFTGGPTSAPVLPSGVTQIHIQLNADSHPSSLSFSYNMDFYPFNSSGTLSGAQQFQDFGPPQAALQRDFVWTLPAGTTAVLATAGGNERHSIGTEITFFCEGQSSTGLQTPCCPPDPMLENKLNQILGLVTSIYQGLPTPINSYAESTVHSGLSGNGDFAVSATSIAVKIELTTVPNYIGSKVSDPIVYFDAGWVSPITGEGAYQATRLQTTPQLLALPALTTRIGYSFAPGIVVRVTELTAGP